MAYDGLAMEYRSAGRVDDSLRAGRLKRRSPTTWPYTVRSAPSGGEPQRRGPRVARGRASAGLARLAIATPRASSSPRSGAAATAAERGSGPASPQEPQGVQPPLSRTRSYPRTQQPVEHAKPVASGQSGGWSVRHPGPPEAPGGSTNPASRGEMSGGRYGACGRPRVGDRIRAPRCRSQHMASLRGVSHATPRERGQPRRARCGRAGAGERLRGTRPRSRRAPRRSAGPMRLHGQAWRARRARACVTGAARAEGGTAAGGRRGPRARPEISGAPGMSTVRLALASLALGGSGRRLRGAAQGTRRPGRRDLCRRFGVCVRACRRAHEPAHHHDPARG